MHIKGRQFTLILSIMLVVMALIVISAIPLQAQGSFATNTPDGSFFTNTPVGDTDSSAEPTQAPTTANAGLFATNTPEASANAQAPQAPLFNYGLRFWLQDDFVNLVINEIQFLNDASTDEDMLAVNVLLYEMEQRFPNAPTNADQRRALITAMINAPIGSLDLRPVLYPFVQQTIDNSMGMDLIEADGFTISLVPANLDGTGDMDAIINVRYGTEDVLRYDEYLLATANDSGSFTVLAPAYNLPATPFNGINSVTVEQLRDVNADGLDELVLRVNDGLASDRFFILQHRNGRAVNLVDSTVQLRVGDIVRWSLDSATSTAPDLVVLEYQAVSDYPDWQCNNQIEYTWSYERNLYRRSQDLNARLTPADSLGCTLREVDLFALPTNEAIAIVEESLMTYGFEDPSINRALMTLASLYVQAGRLDDARNTAESVITVGDDSTWESQQGRALLRATGVAGNTALDICEAIAEASEFPSCDMSAVIGSYFDFITLTTDTDLIEQLNTIGLPVAQSEVVTEIGRAPRTVVNFEYYDSGWWAFVEDRQAGVYRAEASVSPFADEAMSEPLSEIPASQSLRDSLLIDNDLSRVLSIVDNATRENPTLSLSPATLYIQALAYEFTGDRNGARENYYTIWDQHTRTVWGRASAEHLELR